MMLLPNGHFPIQQYNNSPYKRWLVWAVSFTVVILGVTLMMMAGHPSSCMQTMESTLKGTISSEKQSVYEIKRAELWINEIVGIIQTEQEHYKVNRFVLAGSAAKNTGLRTSDIDVVLFIDDVEPPYSSVVRHFWTALETSSWIMLIKGIKLEDIKMTMFSLQFNINGKIAVDLVIGKNFVSEQLNRTETTLLQRHRVMNVITANPKSYGLYSSSISESQVEWILSQPEHIRLLIRTSKLWYKSLRLGSYRSGIKSTLELLCVHSAHQVQSTSIVEQFTYFLHTLTKAHQLKLFFAFNNGESCLLNELPLTYTCIQALNSVPSSIRIKPAFIVEPANPYNEISSDLFTTAGLYKKLRYAAFTTAKKIQPAVVPCNKFIFSQSWFEDLALL